ncbi:MAG: hypothetical protein ACTSPM_13155 [Candidatus Heimdallarchaeota archaeon]
MTANEEKNELLPFLFISVIIIIRLLEMLFILLVFDKTAGSELRWLKTMTILLKLKD